MSNHKYCKTINLENRILSLGYNMISIWECQNPRLSRRLLQREFVPCPHYIVLTLRLYSEVEFRFNFYLKIDCSHIPISVAINDSLTNETVFIEHQDPECLINEFVAELTHRQGIISRRFGTDIQW